LTEILTEPDEEPCVRDTAAYEEACHDSADFLAVTVLITDSPNGMIYIAGIDEGSYKLHEFEALSGYNAGADITVNVYNALLDDLDLDLDESGTVEMSELIAYLNENRGEDNTGSSLINYPGFTKAARIAVYNGTGSQFPGTGGMGRILFIIGGLLIIGLFTGAFVIYRKRSVLNALKIK
jgi:hypothetical protein